MVYHDAPANMPIKLRQIAEEESSSRNESDPELAGRKRRERRHPHDQVPIVYCEVNGLTKSTFPGSWFIYMSETHALFDAQSIFVLVGRKTWRTMVLRSRLRCPLRSGEKGLVLVEIVENHSRSGGHARIVLS